MQTASTVVITGASSGIGRACAIHMGKRGWRVFAGVRRRVDADSLLQEAPESLTPILLDVTDPASIRAAAHLVAEAVGPAGLGGLVNNAGIAYGGPVETLELEEVRRLFDVNFFGLIAVTQAFLPLLRRGRGRIVNMSSISGMVASPFLSPYTSSKWALEALSDAMRVELHPWGIKVSVIQPGAIDTPIWNKGRETADRMMANVPPELREMNSLMLERLMSGLRPHGLSAEHVAQAVSHALTSKRPRTRYHVGAGVLAVDFFRRWPDRWRDAFFLARLRRGT